MADHSLSDLGSAFNWLSLDPERRDGAYGPRIKDQLISLWDAIREAVGPESFDPVLGTVRAGKFMVNSDGAWVQTNGEQGSGFVNMTLEIDRSELSLNVVGWFDPQLDKMEKWLRHPPAWRFLRGLPDWLLVIFVRHAHIAADGKAVFQGAPGTERERVHFSETSPANITTRLTGIRPSLDSGREKLALHIRRAWSAEEVATIEDLPAILAPKVELWLEPIEAMRLA